jgi:hypothetical protein
VQPVSETFPTPFDAVLRVTIGTTREPCAPAFISRNFAPTASDGRPISVIDLEIRNENDDLVERTRYQLDRSPVIVPSQIVMIGCGTFYGTEITLADDYAGNLNESVYRDEWAYPLVKGKYRVRARLELNMHSFFEDNQQLFSEIAPFGANTPPWQAISFAFPEGVYYARESSFEVLESR